MAEHRRKARLGVDRQTVTDRRAVLVAFDLHATDALFPESISMDVGPPVFRLPWNDPGIRAGFCRSSFYASVTPATAAAAIVRRGPARRRHAAPCVIGGAMWDLVTAACFAQVGNQVRCVGIIVTASRSRRS